MTTCLPDGHDGSPDHWLAFAYLSGELSDTETRAFEARLAHDTGAQTALADIVSLTTGICETAVAGAGKLSRRDSIRAVRWSGGAVAAAVCLLAIGLLLPSLSVDSHGTVQMADAHFDHELLTSDEFLAAWSTLSREAIGDESPHLHDDDAEGTLDVPDWMLVAVLEDAAASANSASAEEEQL